jgi:peptide/nickel transport system substrate-binding protein
MIKTLQWLPLTIFIILISACVNDSKNQKETIVFNNEGNPIYVRLANEPDRLNPFTTFSVYSRTIIDQVFASLMAFDPVTLELVPQLVEDAPKVEALSTGKIEYTYQLRKEATWSDGQPVSVADVIFTFKAMFNPLVNSAPYRGYFDFLDDIKTYPSEPEKFTIIANRKYILAKIALSNMVVLPVHIYDQEGFMDDIELKDLTTSEKADQLATQNEGIRQFAEAFNSNKFARDKNFISGAGPYLLENWEEGQKITLKRKQNWWGDKIKEKNSSLTAHPEQVVYRVIQDQNTTVAALKAGELDAAGQIDSKDFSALLSNKFVLERFDLHTPTTANVYYIGINTKKPKLEDNRVRRALAHLVNVESAIENLYDGFAERLVGPFPKIRSYYHNELPLIDYNIEKAKSLLAEAGWEDSNNNGIIDKMIDGERVEMKLDYLTSSSSDFGKSLALIVKESAKKASIEINIISKEFRAITADLKKRDFELCSRAYGLDHIPDDPKQFWHTDSDTPNGSNRFGFGNAETDALIDAIRAELDDGKRAVLYKEFQEAFYEEQPVILLFSPKEKIAISKRLEGSPTIVKPGFFVNTFKILK